MEFKEESTGGQAVTSSNDVRAAGAPSMNGNQPGSVTPVVDLSPVGTQPQPAVTELTSPAAEPVQPHTVTALPPGPPVASPGDQLVNQPCPPADQLAYPLTPPVDQQTQPSGDPITAQVGSGMQPAQQPLHPLQPQSEPVSALSQNLQQNLVITQHATDLQSPAVHLAPGMSQPAQQPVGVMMTQQQLPAMTPAAIPEAPVSEGTTPEQQHLNEISAAVPQQPPAAVVSPTLPTIDSAHPLSPVETAVAQQPARLPAAESTPLQAGTASQAATEVQQPTISDTAGHDVGQQLSGTVAHVTDQQPVDVPAAPADVQRAVEPVHPNQLTESTPAVQSPDLQQPCPPAMGEILVTSTQPSGDVEPRPAPVEQHIQQPAAPMSHELSAPSDAAASQTAQPVPPSAAQVDH